MTIPRRHAGGVGYKAQRIGKLAIANPLDSGQPVAVFFSEALRAEHRASGSIDQPEAISPAAFRTWMMLAVQMLLRNAGSGKYRRPLTDSGGLHVGNLEMSVRAHATAASCSALANNVRAC